MKVVVKEVGKEPYVKEIPAGIGAMQEIVEGHMETFPMGLNVLCVCNEEGKLKDLPPNFLCRGDVIVGNVFFVNAGRENFTSLSQKQIDGLMNFFKKGVWYK